MAIRAFIALTLDDGLVELLARHADDLRAADRHREIRWVSPENYHLTLEFLGNIDAKAVSMLGARLEQELSAHALEAQQFNEVSYFPFVARPRVVAALVHASASLLDIHRRIIKSVRATRLTVQRRRFHPHVTLGRVRSRRVPRLRIQPITLGIETGFCSVTLFESRLGADGATYTPLYEAPLEHGAGAFDEVVPQVS